MEFDSGSFLSSESDPGLGQCFGSALVSVRPNPDPAIYLKADPKPGFAAPVKVIFFHFFFLFLNVIVFLIFLFEVNFTYLYKF